MIASTFWEKCQSNRRTAEKIIKPPSRQERQGRKIHGGLFFVDREFGSNFSQSSISDFSFFA
jgi:hypothetical protein